MSIQNLLEILTEALDAATVSLPDGESLNPPPDGLSLLDTKNELLLSYLQNLTFFIILKIRDHNRESTDAPFVSASDDDVVKNLVSLRVYLERGIRPLESRLKYQIDKLLLAAGSNEAQVIPQSNGVSTRKSNPIPRTDPDLSDASSAGSPSTPPPATTRIADLSYRPNPAAFVRPVSREASSNSRSAAVYRPPQITPALPPTSAKSQRKPWTSHTLNEYVREELDDTPLAQPSIGAGSGLRGKAAEKEAERTTYEEGRLVRLPSEGKKGKRRRDMGEGFGEDSLFGGAGDLGDLVKGSKSSKKRKNEGGERKIGEAWERRVKRGVGRKRR